MDLLAQVEQTIRREALLPRNARVVVAVSGGLDSMVLLDLLYRLAPRFQWRLCIAHFNHRLRGASSQADERLVRHRAKALSLQCITGAGSVRDAARQDGISIEMAARQLRHAFLAAAARRHKATCLALAHHAEDQVELFLLRLLRGTGTGGLAGMRWKSPSAADPKLQLVRPLLGQSKSTLHAYATANEVAYREDTSNQELTILRNRVRHVLVPLLQKEFQPNLYAVLMRQMEILGEENELLNGLVHAWAEAEPRKTFARWPVAIQRRWIQSQLHRLKLNVEFQLIEALRLEPGVPVQIGPKRFVACDNTGRVQVRKPTLIRAMTGSRIVRLDGKRKTLTFAGRHFTWRWIGAGQGPHLRRLAGEEFFDAAKVGASIVLRHWQAGDRFQPIGMPCEVKLQDLFTNLKVPAGERRRRVVATTANGEIWWVEGLRIGEGFKCTPVTDRLLHWNWRDDPDS